MKRNVPFTFITLLLATLAVVCPVSGARAAELRLAGVRLNEPVLNLLIRWGQPTGIGPLASLAAAPEVQQTTGTVAAPQAGMGSTSPMMGAGMGPLMGGRMGMMGGGGATSATQSGAGLLNQQQPKGELRANEGLQYWLYRKPSGVRVILGVEPAGNVSTITAQGPSSMVAVTNRGVHLGSRYSQLERAYGYPDFTRNVPGGAEISYPDLDVRFVVDGATGVVTEITIGTQAVQAAPVPTQVQGGAGGPMGMMGGGMGPLMGGRMGMMGGGPTMPR